MDFDLSFWNHNPTLAPKIEPQKQAKRWQEPGKQGSDRSAFAESDPRLGADSCRTRSKKKGQKETRTKMKTAATRLGEERALPWSEDWEMVVVGTASVPREPAGNKERVRRKGKEADTDERKREQTKLGNAKRRVSSSSPWESVYLYLFFYWYKRRRWVVWRAVPEGNAHG